jgi:predicted trehalose synthase
MIDQGWRRINKGDFRSLVDRASIPYGLGYELNNRPDWVELPLAGILEIAERMPNEGE